MTNPLRFTAVGQALMYHSIRNNAYPPCAELAERLQNTDVAFTNFEGSLSPHSPPYGPKQHPADITTLHDLRWLGFNLLSLANNHALEGGHEGIPYTKSIAEDLGFTTAGTGSTLAEATRAGIMEIQGTRIALIAMESANQGKTCDAVAGKNGQAGVNPLRAERTDDEREFCLNAQDVERNLNTIRQAADQADYVFVSFHEHFWPGAWRDVAFLPSWPEDWIPLRAWKRTLTHQMIDAGATAVLCHGVPRALAVEIYRDRPIFHSLGNFIFHLANPTWWSMEEVWNGFVVTAELKEGRMDTIKLLPIAMVDATGNTTAPTMERHYPALLSGAKSRALLERVASESRALGTSISIVGEEAHIQL